MPPAKRGARPARNRREEREEPKSIEEHVVDVRVEDLDDFLESINIMIYGPAGHGKTCLASGAPNAVFISTEKGVIAAKQTGNKAKIIRTSTWEQVVAAKKWCKENLGEDDWVILDSLTKMQVLMIRWILRMQNEKNGSRDLDIPAIQDHQKWQNYFKRFVDDLVEEKYNTIFICTEQRFDNEDGDTEVIPAITGKNYEICQYVQAQMSVILHYSVARNKDDVMVRRVLAQPWDKYTAPKDRFSVLGRFQIVEDGEWTAMTEFIEMIEDSLAQEAEEAEK